MSQVPSPDERQKRLKRLQDLFENHEHPPQFEWELTEYQRFSASIQKYTRNIPDRLLKSLWFYTLDFRAHWYRRTKRKKREAQERAILLRCVLKGITGPDAWDIIRAWWDWHKLDYDEATWQILRLWTYPKAAKFAQNWLDRLAAAKQELRQERLSGKPRARIIKILEEAGELNAKQIADTLAKDFDGTGNPLAQNDYNAVRQQLVRMAKEGCIQRVGRGLFALPEAIQLTRDECILMQIANETMNCELDEAMFLAGKQSPKYPGWEAKMRRDFDYLFVNYAGDEIEPDAEEIEPEDGKSWSKAKLPF